ncbi:antitoxin VbhA family protein [Bartonella sp. ML70XJBT.G]|uniref:antitoxin VbhA family protein n=1 Tax=Bartonella sp. ML70XJBT.G TaxID=3019093 RepID=UPI00235DE63C|nr:antitoxin VbhA family protein [Bartonella sp. ML70XJBT.G]
MPMKALRNPLSMTPEELKKRREAVDAAVNSHPFEGITLHCETLTILEAYVRGNIS